MVEPTVLILAKVIPSGFQLAHAEKLGRLYEGPATCDWRIHTKKITYELTTRVARQKKLLNPNVVPIDDEQIPRIVEMETRGSIQLRRTVARAQTSDHTQVMIRAHPNNPSIL
jgi:hypothetical protein